MREEQNPREKISNGFMIVKMTFDMSMLLLF